MSVDTIFHAFLCRSLRYWLEMLYVYMPWCNTDPVQDFWTTFTRAIALCLYELSLSSE